MAEQSNRYDPLSAENANVSWKLGPRDFVFKYLKYLPWIIISMLIALALAFIKIRYATKIYVSTSSLLIKTDKGLNKQSGDRFDLFMDQGSANLNNEIQILKSRPVLERVARDLDFQASYLNKGKIKKASLVYPVSPIKLVVIHNADTAIGFSFDISILDDQQFTLGKGGRKIVFGEPFNINGDSCVILRNKEVPIRYLSSFDFTINYNTVADVATYFLGGLSVVQFDIQANILTLQFKSENIDLANNLLNTLMAVYDSITIEDKTKVAQNTLNFINGRLKEVGDQLSYLEGGVKDFRVQNNAFDLEGQSKMYLDNISENSKLVQEQDVKIEVLDYLLNYVNDSKNIYKLVPINVGIDEKVLAGYIEEYNRLVLERDLNLKTTAPNNPLIRGYETSLDNVRGNMIQALRNIKQSYIIAKNDMVHRSNGIESELRSMPGKSMGLSKLTRKDKILEDIYSFLLQKNIETNISSASIVSNSKVIEPALCSGVPIFPK